MPIWDREPVTNLPEWVATGSVPLSDDLSILESALHSRRTEAAELGYTAEPAVVETEEAMWLADDSEGGGRLLTAEDTAATGIEFRPDRRRYRMVWLAEGS
jgi:hypothetical protein